jgi:hypothetical protein
MDLFIIFLVPYSSVSVNKNKKKRRGIWVAGFPRYNSFQNKYTIFVFNATDPVHI